MDQLKQSQSYGPAERPKFDDSISQLIRSAERFITQQKFAFAKEQLELARTLDPKNSYINAIMERVEVAQRQTGGDNQLAVTIDPGSRSGFKEVGDEPVLTAKQLQAQVRHLTSVAEQFMEKGSCDNAFDSLMKAYLLDPLSPYVLSCEKTVLPAWQQSHARHVPAAGAAPSTNHQRENTMGHRINLDNGPMQLSGGLGDEQKRLEALKLQKEIERRERERALWRQASSPPKIGATNHAPTEEQPTQPPAQEKKETGGLFAKLKLGKFLNP